MENELNKVIDFIRNYYKENNLKGCVLGISGGKDSAVVAALMCKAIGKENVVGLTLPCYSSNKDLELAKMVSDYYGFKLYNIDLTSVFDTFKEEVFKIDKFLDDDLKNSDINIKPKLRMASCYYMAALLSSINKGTYLVVGTSNKSELYVGYFTKGGDSVFDINPIADFTVSEVIRLGELLHVPEEVLYRTPSDGLSNMNDEDKLGVKYSDIEKYINKEKLDESISLKIEKLHKGCQHKFNKVIYKKED